MSGCASIAVVRGERVGREVPWNAEGGVNGDAESGRESSDHVGEGVLGGGEYSCVVSAQCTCFSVINNTE